MSAVDPYLTLKEAIKTPLTGDQLSKFAEVVEKECRDTTDVSECLMKAERLSMVWCIYDDIWCEVGKDILLFRVFKGRYRGGKISKRMSYLGLKLLTERYLLKDEEGRVRETPEEAFRRVAQFVALAESRYGNDALEWGEEFYELMSDFRFLPNSPTIMNAATRRHQLAACFVVPVEDDTEAILDAVRVTALILKTGAGSGSDFTKLRPRGDVIAGTGGKSSGPLSFMKLFDSVAEVIREGGKRRGALMGTIHDTHPDLLDFIRVKSENPRELENFNISVMVHDALVRNYLEDKPWRLYNPRTCPESVNALSSELEDLSRKCSGARLVSSEEVVDSIAQSAWECGDPGVIFIDRINEHNPTPHLGRIAAVNPCGESPLLDWEACNLGSVSLPKYVVISGAKPGIAWKKLAHDVEVAIRFLDDVIDMSWYPDKRIEEAVLRTRKVGLGVMGVADFLATLGIRYDSDDALYLMDKVMEFIAYHARKASNELAEERGPYPAFRGSIHERGVFNFEPQVPADAIYDESRVSREVKELVSSRPQLDWEALREEMKKGTRNATVTTVAPTGSISIIAGVSSGIEPYFALVYIRETTIGRFIEVNPHLKRWLRKRGYTDVKYLIEIAEKGGVEEVPWVDEELKKVLRTALEVGPEWHVKMQAVFQRWVDNAVSKTVNLRRDVDVRVVKDTFLLAWRLGCKGVTVFRDRSKPEQVLKVGESVEEELAKIPKPPTYRARITHRWLRIGKKELMSAYEDYAGGCPTCDL